MSKKGGVQEKKYTFLKNNSQKEGLDQKYVGKRIYFTQSGVYVYLKHFMLMTKLLLYIAFAVVLISCKENFDLPLV